MELLNPRYAQCSHDKLIATVMDEQDEIDKQKRSSPTLTKQKIKDLQKIQFTSLASSYESEKELLEISNEKR